MARKVCKLYHPSHRVPDLGDAERFFTSVFGLPSVWRSSLYTAPDPKYPTYPTDYCIFTCLADVFFDCIDPQKYVIDDIQRYDTVTKPKLNGFGWAVEGIEEFYTDIYKARGMRCTDQADRVADPEICPEASFKKSKLFYTLAEDTGVRYEFYPSTSVGSYDHRENPEWKLRPREGKGSLGIQFCAYHTVLTEQLDRALGLYVDVLGGRIIHRARNDVRRVNSTYVLLADAVYELSSPLPENSYANVEFKGRRHHAQDVYHALTFKVTDLAKVKAHFQAKGLRILAESESLVVLHPEDGLGIPWGFTSALIPGDDRYEI
ncbi:hypothetical protein FE257_010708 [Aspergillus nanangensis]|uniref:VOC domain-containing protein n=1 Tax=Aspergillus nanangensis TaxID=2582783 RepID=A0AAD4CJX9_ASPNN|nr:hypothetical protein FE257_010708 [Aspergillus nanangensis]